MPHLDGPFSDPFIYSRLRLPLACAIIFFPVCVTKNHRKSRPVAASFSFKMMPILKSARLLLVSLFTMPENSQVPFFGTIFFEGF